MNALQEKMIAFRSASEMEPANSSSAIELLTAAENIISDGKSGDFEKSDWFDFLNNTSNSLFLNKLDSGLRKRWSELVFKIIQQTNYSFCDLFEQRVQLHPLKVLFRDMSQGSDISWTYRQIRDHLREIAAVFYSMGFNEPRVALFLENSVEGACCDLACLVHHIYVVPLNTHFRKDTVEYIINLLDINIVVTDSAERMKILQEVNKEKAGQIRIFSSVQTLKSSKELTFIGEMCKRLTSADIDMQLKKAGEVNIKKVATTMFTSGSTGMPKGVSFSDYNLLSKRFARAAAFPAAGPGELFLCYLPLYHTFGRYLEMMGSIYWSGTYVFTGNPSAETLLSLFPKVNPTAFISIPLRWQELYEKCQAATNGIKDENIREKALKLVTGNSLKWGLSAAGYLDPAVFHYFNANGISLCSGFGMTEATGGITMTLPGNYVENSVGLPLPGVFTRLSNEGELQLSGHYIASYLEDAGPNDEIPFPGESKEEKWISTGDIFEISDDGQHHIIDRIKDIYKNSKGQTVAPQTIENKFIHVPAIKKTFLVGDNKPYNVLLIVPDKDDILVKSCDSANLAEYYHRILMTANADLAPYERVVNFSILDRDFSEEKSEITAKGTFNRKQVENNFESLISSLYVSNFIVLKRDDFQVSVPRWFYRDLGILESDILINEKGLLNRNTNTFLLIEKIEGNSYQIGNFRYEISQHEIDLGLFTRQPALWAGNPGIIEFCPVKEGWDLQYPGISLPDKAVGYMQFSGNDHEFEAVKNIRDENFNHLNSLLSIALYGNKKNALTALHEIAEIFRETENRSAALIRNRLAILAWHPEEDIRCHAYRILLTNDPDPENSALFTSFIDSGLSFLNENSMSEIIRSNIGRSQLDALKKRLYSYRTYLSWPASDTTRIQFEGILNLLYKFAYKQLGFYVSIRAELARWILHKADPYISAKAEELFYSLAFHFQEELEKTAPHYKEEFWKNRLMFEHGISDKEIDRLEQIFVETAFLQESVILAFSEKDFIPDQVIYKGIWITRLQAYKDFMHYRLSINTKTGKHFDLHLVISENPDFKPKPENFFWLASLAGFPYGTPVAPYLGSNRSSLAVLSTQYIGGLSVWDKIRAMAEVSRSGGDIQPSKWRKLFIKAFAVIFRAWKNSGYQIVPGVISPSNVAVPEMDFRENATILSLTGWSVYKNAISIIGPILQDFYCKTAALYPWCKKYLDAKWIFDGCMEGVGVEDSLKVIRELDLLLKEKGLFYYDGQDFKVDLEQYKAEGSLQNYLPLALFNAIDQYADWLKMNPLTEVEAREQTILELAYLYKLDQKNDFIRYYLFRHTYFADFPKAKLHLFDLLLMRMKENSAILPVQLLELSDLQSAMNDDLDKMIFSRMVFPGLQKEQKVDIMRTGEREKLRTTVQFELTDKTGNHYIFREPADARETGLLYQLFYRENYPREISEYDHSMIVCDMENNVVGGLSFRILENNSVSLDGLVVCNALQGKGIASAMIEDFFAFMAGRSVKLVRAHFLFGNYYLKHYFKVDKRWGAMVREL